MSEGAGAPQGIQIDSEDIIEEPKSGMQFNSFEELIEYYKDYAKKCGFGVMTQRSERGEDGCVRYVTLGCARGGKARNRMLNVTKPRPTRKTDCKAKINALKLEGKLQLTTVHNIHNHGLSPQKSQFIGCNGEVSDFVKGVQHTNDLADIQMNKSFGSFIIGAGESLVVGADSCELGDHHPNAKRYSHLLNICYQMITYAATSNEHTEDAGRKLYEMIDLYRQNQQAPSMTLIGSNVSCPTLEQNTIDSSKPVLSPLVVRGKGKPSAMKRASTMEKQVPKVKTKNQKSLVKGKRKQPEDPSQLEETANMAPLSDKWSTPIVEAQQPLAQPPQLETLEAEMVSEVVEPTDAKDQK